MRALAGEAHRAPPKLCMLSPCRRARQHLDLSQDQGEEGTGYCGHMDTGHTQKIQSANVKKDPSPQRNPSQTQDVPSAGNTVRGHWRGS